ncbi:MAG: Ig-like domain-containing protein [Planctomycetota bacterium]
MTRSKRRFCPRNKVDQTRRHFGCERSQPRSLRLETLDKRVLLAGDLLQLSQTSLFGYTSEYAKVSDVSGPVQPGGSRIVINDGDGSAQSIALGAGHPSVVELSMGCTGTVIGATHILTAQHCTFGLSPNSVQVFFHNDNDGAAEAVRNVTAIDEPDATDNLLDGTDIAVITIDAAAPAFAPPLSLSTNNPEGVVARTVGFGFNGVGSIGHSFTADGLRWAADNVIDVFGAARGTGGGSFGGTANIFNTDFDDGTISSNSLSPGVNSSPQPIPFEGTTAPGDSGGPLLVNDQIVGVLSGGTSAVSDFGDISWWTGSLAHQAFIESIVPDVVFANNALTLPVTLVDGDGFDWDVQTDGRIGSGTSTAFNGGLIKNGFPNFTTAAEELDGRQLVIGPQVTGGVEVTRKVYVPDDQRFARYLEVIHNPSGSVQNHTVSIDSNFAAIGLPSITGTSSGDDDFTTDDRWITTANETQGGSELPVAHVIAGTNSDVLPNTVNQFANVIQYSYDLTLQPGETQIVMHFAGQYANNTDAQTDAADLADVDGRLNPLSGMTPTEMQQVINFGELFVAQPDLQAVEITVQPSTSGLFFPGDILDFDWTIENIGAGPAELVDVGFYVSDDPQIDIVLDDLIDFDEISTLNPGQSFSGTAEFFIPLNFEPGDYYLGVFADDLEDLDEIDETNNVATVRFEVARGASISGTVFTDQNADGVIDPADSGLSQQVVYLDLNTNGQFDTGEPTATTDANGDYLFEELLPGDYVVELVTPTASLETLPNEDSLSNAFVVEFDVAGQFSRDTLIGDNPGVDPRLDVDLYALSLGVNDVLRIDVDTDTSVGSLDSLLRVFDSAGTEIDSNDDGVDTGETPGNDSFLEFVPPSAGDYFVSVSEAANTLFDPGSLQGNGSANFLVGGSGGYVLNLTVTDTTPPPQSDFNIEIVFTDNNLSVSQQALFTSAAARWSQIIIGDIPDFGAIDDLQISTSAPAIDGVNGILGQAGPTLLRGGSFLPIEGIMQFDIADVDALEASGQLEDVILHEMGHVIGFGTIWDNLGLLDDSDLTDPRYLGSGAVAEYNALFGVNVGGVPVEDDGGPGTALGHWEENEPRDGTTVSFQNELMTGFLSGATRPISRVTVAQFEDLGYQVNFAAADSFLPSIVAASTREEPVYEGRVVALTPNEARKVARQSKINELLRHTGELNSGLNVIQNGDFELGDLTGWVSSQTGGGSGFLINNGNLDPVGPVAANATIEGSFDVVVQQTGVGSSTISQSFVVPDVFAAADLHYSSRIFNQATDFADPNQEFRVELRDDQGTLIRVLDSTDPGDALTQIGPNEVILDLSLDFQGREGQTVELAFTEQDSLGFLNVYLDEIGLYFEGVADPDSAQPTDGRWLVDADNGVVSTEVNFGIRPDNVSLTGVDDSISTVEDQSLTIDPATLLGNDSATNGASFRLLAVSDSGTSGDVQILGSGEIEYQPSPGFTGPDSFQYEIVDEFGFATATATVTVQVDPAPVAVVINRRFLYNNSFFDGNDANANVADDNAVPTDKIALLPGQVATFANYTSYSRGINAIVMDVDTLADPDNLSASDFNFRVGNVQDTDAFTPAPAPISVSARPLGGSPGVSRVTILWADNAIEKQWLEVTMLASAVTGLASPDVSYFGNAVGESGNSTSQNFVDTFDLLGARDNPHNFLNRAPIDDIYDYNRDSFVDTFDVLVARDNGTNFLNDLVFLDLSAAMSPLAVTGNFESEGELAGTSVAAPSLLPASGTSLDSQLRSRDDYFRELEQTSQLY